MILERITVEFADDDEHHTFDGYTDLRRWNGWECPWFTVEAAESALARINYRTRRATIAEAPHGGLWVNESGDLPTDAPYLLACKPMETVDGSHALIDCGGWLVFQRHRAAEPQEPKPVEEIDLPAPPCPHPEHRLGTNGRLRKHQRVCLQCGEVVVISSRARR